MFTSQLIVLFVRWLRSQSLCYWARPRKDSLSISVADH